MSDPRYPALRRETYSDDPTVDEWARSYLEDKETYYDELLGRVDRLASPEDAILEIGSVPCQFTSLLDRAGYDVTGVDVDPDRIRPFVESYELDVLKCDVERNGLPVDDDTVDLVLLTEVLEHLRIDPLYALREVRRVLRPEGELLLTTPNQYRLPSVWEYLKGNGAISHAHAEFSKLERLGHMGHVREYAPADLRTLLEREGFTIVSHRFSNFGSRPAPDRPILGRLAERIQAAVPWTRRVQIAIAKTE